MDVQEADDEDESSDKDENSDNYENDHEQNDETKNARAIVDLISQVNAWCRFEGTQS
jgi:TATA-binding protein-associated factor Taf7